MSEVSCAIFFLFFWNLRKERKGKEGDCTIRMIYGSFFFFSIVLLGMKHAFPAGRHSARGEGEMYVRGRPVS